MNNYFRNRRVLITGGSSGVGYAVAKHLAASGAHVWIVARRPELLSKAAQEIERCRVSPEQVFGSISANVYDEEEITAKLNEFCAGVGVPDILINSAGIAHPGKFEETDTAIFRSMMRTNFFGTVYPTKAIVPGMIQRKSGHIVNFGSMAGVLGVYGYTAYGASKAAIRGFSSALRDEMRLYGVHVSVVYPTDIQTPQLEYEKPLQPAITRIIAGNPVTAEYAAGVIVDGIARHRFVITPGFDATLYWLLLSVVGWLEKPIMDFIVDDARRKIKSGQAKM